jgi:hypothetical protein
MIWGSHSGGYEVATCFHTGFLLGLFFDPEDRGDMFLQNVSWLLTDHTALHNLFSSQLTVIRSCPLQAKVPPTIFCMHVSTGHSYSAHQSLPHSSHNSLHMCTYENKHIHLHQTWVTGLTHRVICIYTTSRVVAMIGVCPTLWLYILKQWLWVSYYILNCKVHVTVMAHKLDVNP